MGPDRLSVSALLSARIDNDGEFSVYATCDKKSEGCYLEAVVAYAKKMIYSSSENENKREIHKKTCGAEAKQDGVALFRRQWRHLPKSVFTLPFSSNEQMG